MFMYNTRPV